jgi:hypothetical protein
MNTEQINKNISNKFNPNEVLHSPRKEVNMSTKSALRIVLSACLLVVIVLAVQMLITKSDANTTAAVHPANYYVGSDWIERHPSVVRPANYYTLSDYYERHRQDPYAGSDYYERHRQELNAGTANFELTPNLSDK